MAKGDSDDRIVPAEAAWPREQAYKAEPNRVRSLQVSDDVFRPPVPAASFLPPGPAVSQSRSAPPSVGAQSQTQPTQTEPSYYDVSPLQPSVWKWEIAIYFFLGGISGSSFLLARAAERAGGRKYAELTRWATYVSFLSLLPCPPLLIVDLGDAKRFHHMLRVFKPSSPMSLGTWVITSYSLPLTTATMREVLRDPTLFPKRAEVDRIAGMPNQTFLAVQDAAGAPLALLLIGYTGVLLSTSSNPLWCQNPWLGALFSASAVSTGAAATSLAMNLAGSSSPHSASQRALHEIDTVAHVAEAVTLAGFLRHAGAKADVLTKGKYRSHLGATVFGIVAAEALKRLPFHGPRRRMADIASSLLGLAAGLSLRWSMVYGGHEAAKDPHTARLVSRADRDPITN